MDHLKNMFRSSLSELKKGSEIKKSSALIPVIFLVFGIVVLNSCIKDPTLPTLITSPGINLTINSITSGGEIKSDGGAAVTAKGVCWGTAANPTNEGPHTTDGQGPGIFASNITGLSPNTMYYLRAYAVNAVGVAYGNEIIFTTDAAAPELTTAVVSSVSPTTATSGGNITYDGDASILERGICWSTNPEPDISDSFVANGTGSGIFISNISGLTPGTQYFVRAYAKNRAGIAYGDEIRFNTQVADVEDNRYNTVTIGTRVWMAENLRTVTYNDNTPIPHVTADADWIAMTSPAYCWLRNDIATKQVHGALYNWYTVSTDKLCPSGWHAPTDAEYSALEVSLGMSPAQTDLWEWRGTDQGTQIKSTTGWAEGENGTNLSGFSAIAGGYRYGATGAFNGIDILTYWWSSEYSADYAWYRRVDGANSGIYRHVTSKRGGKYVRCIKN